MPWIGPVVGAVAGGLMGGSQTGASTTQSKEPWGAAAPWLRGNIDLGQSLQNRYMGAPFSPMQQAAYGNQFAGADYLNSIVPGLLQHLSQPVGFDRGNPQAKPPGMGLLQGPSMTPMTGLLGQGFSQAQSIGAPAPQAQAPAQGPPMMSDPQQIAWLMQTIGAGG